MNKTPIDWAKNPDGTQGYTWNPITGCLNHVNGMCKGGNFPCYAYRLAHGRLKQRYLANRNYRHPLSADEGQDIFYEFKRSDDPFYPRFWPKRLDEFTPYNHEKKPKGIFVCDMGELFGDWIPRDWFNQIWACIVDHPEYCFYLLTKQPQNLIKFSPFPDNCWVGVTATNTKMLHNACFYLSEITAKLKYLSLEPLLSCEDDGYNGKRIWASGINWLIIGAQTKPYKPPKIEWVEEIESACNKAGIAVFEKNNLNPLLDYNLRQELPSG